MSQPHIKEYVITVPKGHAMQHNIMRFHGGLNVDFDKWPDLCVKMERENNMREYKTNDEDVPKFGAGSEFGREAREEARRKKYGITLKKYRPDDQPWLMKVGTHKTARKYKGTREGGITENASYYIFTPGKNNTFEAYPIKEWYNFIPIQRYKALTEEEAEEQFNRRDRTLNYFALMVNKKIKGDSAEGGGGEEDGEGGKKKGKQKTLKFDDSDFEDSERSEGEDDGPEGSDAEKSEKKEKGKGKGKKGPKKSKAKKGTDSEAEDDSGDGDQEGLEVDYMSSDDQSSESDLEERVRDELKGVADESGLKQLLTSDEEGEEEKKPEEEKEEEEEEKETPKEKGKKEKKKKKKPKKEEDSSYSSTTDSEDEEQQKKKAEKESGKAAAAKIKEEIKTENDLSRPSTPKQEDRKKRPLESPGFTSSPKMAKLEPGLSTPGTSGAQFAEGLNEETLRRYLARKPMTAVDLLALFRRKKTGLSTDQLVAAITDMLKRINPIKQKIQGKTYFSLRK